MGNFEHISVEQAKAMMATKKVAVVDIRDESMFNLAHIPNSLHLHGGVMTQFMQETDEDTPVIVTCYHGISSQPAAQYIAEQGYTKVYSLDGGFTQWQSTYPEDIATITE
ncbi:MAG: thiosulfate sulfurtransferase GlpE [Glaciecola sp.]|jgi:thiosulfate sulfurtransferase|nr:thiosulfate sulfurtransferase GlpE [Glaciecola sp.]